MSLLLVTTLTALGSLYSPEIAPPPVQAPVIRIKRKGSNGLASLYALVDESGEIEIACDCVTPPDDDGTYVIEVGDEVLTVALYDAYEADATVWAASAWHLEGSERVIWDRGADFAYTTFEAPTELALDVAFTAPTGEVKTRTLRIQVTPKG